MKSLHRNKKSVSVAGLTELDYSVLNYEELLAVVLVEVLRVDRLVHHRQVLLVQVIQRHLLLAIVQIRLQIP